jgi:hypothetical protein
MNKTKHQPKLRIKDYTKSQSLGFVVHKITLLQPDLMYLNRSYYKYHLCNISLYVKSVEYMVYILVSGYLAAMRVISHSVSRAI